jgi:hypothetical protein
MLSTDESQAVSLFPFLAVLLSTIGALLIVLVVMARQARLRAVQEQKPSPASAIAQGLLGSASSPEGDVVQLQQTAARLRAVREAGRKELEESRLRLRHADHHLRELQAEVATLYQQVRSLEEIDTHRLVDKEQAEQELARLRELIRDTEAQVDEQRREAKSQNKTYAIIPYQGPHGTHRRPLYIECRHNAVVLRPEGIELQPSDFQGPLGPGNPLASALRAADEYFSSNEPAEGLADEPYPLILVRPDGIAAYYLVRRALEGWGNEFGYELLDSDWQLQFPLPNPQLANRQQQAIDLARARQRALALDAPRQFGEGGFAGGGIGGSSTGGKDGSFVGLTPALPSRPGPGRGGWATGSAVSQASNRHDASIVQKGPTSSAFGRSAMMAAGSGVANGQSQPEGNPDTIAMPGKEAPGLPMPHEGTPDGTGGANSVSGAETSSPGDPSGPGQSSSAGRSATGLARGQAEGVPGAMGTMASGSTVPMGGALTSPGIGPATPGVASATTGSAFSMSASNAIEPLAELRGSNWALPEAGMGAVPVRRAIHVLVRQDRLAVLPEQGTNGGRLIRITTSLADATDPFVKAIGERIASWGTAGHSHYWQPILIFKSSPEGQPHTAALRQLLAGSGLEIAP